MEQPIAIWRSVWRPGQSAERELLFAAEALAGAGLRQRLTNFEAEIVHRRLLAHRQIFALRLPLGLFLRAGDIDRHRGGDLRVKMDGRRVKAERLDRVEQGNLVAVNGKARRRYRLRDVAGRHRTIELTGFAGLADNDEALAVQFRRDRGGLALELEIARLELMALAFEFLFVAFGGAQSLA